jgi:hypothetical protein
MRFLIIALFLTGCPKKVDPHEVESEKIEIDWPEDDELEGLPEDTGY